MPLQIDIVSDVVCPWCLIGSRRVELALEKLGKTDAVVAFHPFLLDPTIPDEGVDLRERLRSKFGADPEKMFGRVEAEARSSGIPLDFAKVRRYPSTVKAHTLVRHAEEKGTQRALARALFDAYCLEGKDIGEDDELVALATAHGFEAEDAGKLIRDTAELAATKTAAAEASSMGVTGVPFVIVDRKMAVSGAQPVDVFAQVFDRALSGR